MTFIKTTITVGGLLALGLGVGTADQAVAGSGCGNMAGDHGQGYGNMMTYLKPGARNHERRHHHLARAGHRAI